VKIIAATNEKNANLIIFSGRVSQNLYPARRYHTPDGFSLHLPYPSYQHRLLKLYPVVLNNFYYLYHSRSNAFTALS